MKMTQIPGNVIQKNNLFFLMSVYDASFGRKLYSV